MIMFTEYLEITIYIVILLFVAGAGLIKLKKMGDVCKHVFRGPDMGSRVDGTLEWPCSKCGKVFEFEYGLQAMDHGKILGPWGTRKGDKP